MTDTPTITHEDLNAYVDGLLPKQNVPKVESWLSENPEEAAAVHAYHLQNSLLHQTFDPVLDEKIPAKLKAVVARRHHLAKLQGSPWIKLAASILMVMAGAIGGWLIQGGQSGPATSPGGQFVEQALGAHRVFVAEVRHPVEVPSSQEAHLVAWLSKRLGTPLRAPNMTEMGFQLVGGRLLADGAQPAAQFMYETEGGQRLTVYIRGAVDAGNTAFRFSSDGGNSAFYWIDKEFAYALVGPLKKDMLMPIVNKVYSDLELR